MGLLDDRTCSWPASELNSGHRRAAHGAPGSAASPSSAPFSWSPPSASEPSSSSVPHDLLALYSCNRQKYCPDDLFGRCYNRPRRDPPVPVSQMYLPHQRILTEPETAMTTVSSSRSCLGTPPAGESLWWPDEHITPSCVESVSSGIVYEREDEQVVLRYDDMASSFDGSTYSYAPLDDPAYQPPQQLNKTIPPTRKADNRSRPALYIQCRNGSGSQRDVRAWARTLRRYELFVDKPDATLRKYRAESFRAVPTSAPWTWQPGSMSAWPRWA